MLLALEGRFQGAALPRIGDGRGEADHVLIGVLRPFAPDRDPVLALLVVGQAGIALEGRVDVAGLRVEVGRAVVPAVDVRRELGEVVGLGVDHSPAAG